MGNNEENQRDKEQVTVEQPVPNDSARPQNEHEQKAAEPDQPAEIENKEGVEPKETEPKEAEIDKPKTKEQPEQPAGAQLSGPELSVPKPPEPELSEIDILKKHVGQLTKESASYKDKWLRVEADMDNYKKRVHKEKLEQLKYGYETLIRELLPVIDNLERAIEYSKKHLQKDSLYEGVELTLKMLKKVIEGFGVSTIETIGQIFDPNFHEGLGVEESEGCEDNVIVKEVEKGYIYNDRLLRPAKVIVGKKTLSATISE